MASRAGSPNKNKRGLLARLQREFPEYHPVVEMARIANDPENDVHLRGTMHGNVAKYVTPQMKAIDLNMSGTVNVGHKQITDEQWAALAQVEHVIEGGTPGGS